jgi:hypothetical protein
VFLASERNTQEVFGDLNIILSVNGALDQKKKKNRSRAHRIDPYVSGLNPLRRPLSARDVIGEDGRRQAVLDRICPLEHLLLVAPLEDGHDGPEDLFASDAHRRLDPRKHSGLDEEPALELGPSFGHLPPADDSRALGLRRGNEFENAVPVACGYDGAHGRLHVGWYAGDVSLWNSLLDDRDDFVVD